MKRSFIDFFSSPLNNNIGLSEVFNPCIFGTQQQFQEKVTLSQTEKAEINGENPINRAQPIQALDQNFFNQEDFHCQYQNKSIVRNLFNFNDFNNFQSNNHVPIQESLKKREEFQISEQINEKYEKYPYAFEQSQSISNNPVENQDQDEYKKVHSYQHISQEQFITPKRKSKFIGDRNHLLNTQKGNSASRSTEKGLKNLSSMAYSFVNHSKSASYKQVAKKLLDKLQMIKEFTNQENSSQALRLQKNTMMNVKRRIYDSLNVLLALGVLRKVGNKVYKNQNKKQQTPLSQSQSFNQDLITQLQAQQSLRKSVVEKKKKIHKDLKDKLQSHRSLIQRNKKRQLVFKQSQNQKIKFPFIMTAFQSSQFQFSNNNNKKQKIRKKTNKVNVIRRKNRKNLITITLPKNTEGFGDYDAMNLLNCILNKELVKENNLCEMDVKHPINYNQHQNNMDLEQKVAQINQLESIDNFLQS